ncbi:MAG: CBS domain-containing protein [Methanothrix sp.]|nr:CBS domain-containing protein [Methanothrix sp.]
MIRKVVTIRQGSNVEEAARIMMTEGITHLPVTNERGKLAGIVTARDVSKAVALKYTLLEEIMTRKVVTSAQDEPIEQAAKRMNEHNISALRIWRFLARAIQVLLFQSGQPSIPASRQWDLPP